MSKTWTWFTDFKARLKLYYGYTENRSSENISFEICEITSKESLWSYYIDLYNAARNLDSRTPYIYIKYA